MTHQSRWLSYNGPSWQKTKGDQSSQKPDQSPRSMFTLFTVRVFRASTHLHSLVHFLGIYQFDSVTLSLVYFLSGPISENIFTSNVSRPKVLKYFTRIPITEIPCRPPHPGAESPIYLQNFKVISTRGPIQIALLQHRFKIGKIFKIDNFVSAERQCTLCCAQAIYTQQIYLMIYDFAYLY